MNAFDATLTRAFAEMEEPADDGFSAVVSGCVARHERSVKLVGLVHQIAVGAACLALAFGGLELARAFGPELMASLGLELARAHGALSQVEPIQPVSLLATIGGALSQFLLAAGVAAGGIVALRAVQQD